MKGIRMLLRSLVLFSLIASYSAIAADSDDGDLPNSPATIQSVIEHKDSAETKANAHR